jgi:catechol 2,3-dioxygenase-like lactoylglutathione lyase family enzyme
MKGYVSLGTNDFDRAIVFYEALLADLGAQRFWDEPGFVAWTCGPDTPGLALTKPFDGKPATVGNGTMVAIAVKDRATVDGMHAKALELGAQDEGAPGPRTSTFYGAYFRDLDGNKLCAYIMEAAAN